MHTKAIVHIMTKARMKTDEFTAEIDALEDLSHRHGIRNVIFYKGDEIEYKDLINKLERLGILLFHYANKEDLKQQILDFNEKFEIIYINTTLELLVNTTNEMREVLDRPVSDNPLVFRDKYVQRTLLQEHNPDLGVKFVTGIPGEIDIEYVEEYIGYPCIIKPTEGLQSSGVSKITSRKDFDEYMLTYQDFHDRLQNRGVDSQKLIIEEYIDGKMYSVDYFVTSEGEVRMTPALKVGLMSDLGINDYACIARLATEKTEKELKGKRLKNFAKANVKAMGLRNTFIHHEFKINSKGELKTIEVNGRIGGGRISVLKKAFNMNVYEFIFNPDVRGKTLTNSIDINIYATTHGILKGYNKKIFEKLEKRESVVSIEKNDRVLDKEIGPTHEGFTKIGKISLSHKDYKVIRKDYLYIKSRYEELLDIEIDSKQPPKIQKKLFSNIVKIFKK